MGDRATHRNEYLHFKFDEKILQKTGNIAQRELFTIVIAIKVLATQLAGNVVKFYMDNENALVAINKGKTHDEFMLDCLREITWYTAKYEILLRAVYIRSKENILPDALSRWYKSSEARRTVKRNITRAWKC